MRTKNKIWDPPMSSRWTDATPSSWCNGVTQHVHHRSPHNFYSWWSKMLSCWIESSLQLLSLGLQGTHNWTEPFWERRQHKEKQSQWGRNSSDSTTRGPRLCYAQHSIYQFFFSGTWINRIPFLFKPVWVELYVLCSWTPLPHYVSHTGESVCLSPNGH
jgi:hypothetical protein